MVAYSFKSMFVPSICARSKRQTVRADRKRHALPGEPLQLYTGMRTRDCWKLIDPDPVCIANKAIVIDLPFGHPHMIAAIEIEGVPLSHSEILQFAIDDGFGREPGNPVYNMGRFWLDSHGAGCFEGRLIQWRER